MSGRFADFHDLTGILHQIYKLDVALESSHLLKKQLLMLFFQNFRDYCVKKCPIFSKYYHHVYFTGSYFEGLRVKQANEFDVNVAFNFPFRDISYMVSELDALLSYATVQLKLDSDEFKSIPFYDSEGYIVGKNILKWFQSLVDSFINSYDLQYPGVRLLKPTSSGPARTVKVLYYDVWISIDIVPVFSMNTSYLLKHTIWNNLREPSTCYLVPKPLKPELACLLPSDVSERAWKIQFPATEKLLIRKNKCAKQIIMLAKALRDKEDWPIPSYFLKVVALWLIKEHPNSEFWDKKNLGHLFILFLESLKNYLSVQHLGHIFYPEVNLFHSLNRKLLRDLEMRIKKIISELREQPDSAFILFKVMDISVLPVKPLLLHN